MHHLFNAFFLTFSNLFQYSFSLLVPSCLNLLFYHHCYVVLNFSFFVHFFRGSFLSYPILLFIILVPFLILLSFSLIYLFILQFHSFLFYCHFYHHHHFGYFHAFFSIFLSFIFFHEVIYCQEASFLYHDVLHLTRILLCNYNMSWIILLFILLIHILRNIREFHLEVASLFKEFSYT